MATKDVKLSTKVQDVFFTYRKYDRLPDGRRVVNDWSLPVIDEYDESITDPSFAHPASALSQGLKTSAAYGALAQQFYDFPDGKDDGSALPLARKKGVDMAELSQDVAKRQSDIEADQKASADKEAQDKSFADALSSLQNAVNGSTASQTASAE